MTAEKHASFERVMALAREKWGRPITQIEVARNLGETKQQLSNWARVGVSGTGALKMEREWGWRALYILDGTGQQYTYEAGAPEAAPEPAGELFHYAAALALAALTCTGSQEECEGLAHGAKKALRAALGKEAIRHG